MSPLGTDASNSSEARPFQSLARAQRAVRAANPHADVIVELADGIYRLREPLQFRAINSGQAGTHVVWQAAANAAPVIAGSVPVTKWKLFNAEHDIYVADIPKGIDSRQIWIGDRLATLASIELPRASVGFDADGMTITDSRYDYLADLPDQHRIEVQSTGWFTNRISPVDKITRRGLAHAAAGMGQQYLGLRRAQRPRGRRDRTPVPEQRAGVSAAPAAVLPGPRRRQALCASG